MNSKGYLMLAVGKSFLKQAIMCAISIKATQSISNVSVVTNETVPEKFLPLFDKVINIPFREKVDYYKVEDRCNLFHVSPYDETVVVDTDVIFLDDVSHYWKYLKNYDICFATDVYTYRQEIVTDDYYRKTFTANNLPNIYNVFHYFKKSDQALDYYHKLIDVAIENEKYYNLYVKKLKPNVKSMDVTHAITVLDKNIENFTMKSIKITHMKSKVQGWAESNNSWISSIPYYFTNNLTLKVGNYLQHGIFHYTEDQFCDDIFEKYEGWYDRS